MAGIMRQVRPRFLTRPVVEVVRDGAAVRGALVRLQDRKAARGLQPDPDSLVFFTVDGDGLPVAVDFLERRDPLAVLRDLLDLVVRSSAGARRRFSDPAYLGRVHGALRRAASRLPAHPSFASA